MLLPYPIAEQCLRVGSGLTTWRHGGTNGRSSVRLPRVKVEKMRLNWPCWPSPNLPQAAFWSGLACRMTTPIALWTEMHNIIPKALQSWPAANGIGWEEPTIILGYDVSCPTNQLRHQELEACSCTECMHSKQFWENKGKEGIASEQQEIIRMEPLLQTLGQSP